MNLKELCRGAQELKCLAQPAKVSAEEAKRKAMLETQGANFRIAWECMEHSYST